MKYGKYRMNMIDDASYADKKNAFSNVGEGIQAVAMDYIFSQLHIEQEDICYINRDEDFDGRSYADMVMPVHMGLYGENRKRLPLPPQIRPVFTSMVLYYDFLKGGGGGESELLNYLKKYEPIGCRDEQTREILRRNGINAYLMGCFSICLPKRSREPLNGKVFMIDTPKGIEPYMPLDLLKDVEYVTHSIPFNVYPVTVEEDARQKGIAYEYLKRYKENAKLVITGRLHAAVPCMAMGIPVILIREEYDFRFGWVDKFLPLYTMSNIPEINWYPVSVDVEWVKKHIISYLRKSLFDIERSDQELIELDAFFASRVKTIFNQNMRKTVQWVAHKLKKSNFNYAIWGAGAHCRFLHDIMEEMYPKANLTVIVDKYRKGDIFGVPIVTEAELDKYEFEHMFITTLPGKNEAIEKLKQMYGDRADSNYSVLTATMRS